MDVIRLLPDSVANQIAAGEVVQRPSSVVKELLENSIDAGADSIELWLTDAGKNCIQVIDNGKGMSETDARLSFERHATSKIKEARDLFNLHTMGFRGEALASIASVAQVELQTRRPDDEMGVSITIEGARFIDQHPVMCPAGANFAVRNLFFNVPARRRFLKSNVTEMNNVMQEFERVALINPQVAFKLYRDDNLALHLRPGTFKQRILSLFGQALDKQLLPISVETDIVCIEGFVGNVQSAKLKSYRQFFFVNERYMRHAYFNKAVQAAFERLLPPEKQVSFFLRLTVDPAQIDVNIHPSKTEIKFEDERAIFQLILVAVRDALGKYNAVPTIDFDNTLDLNIPTFHGGNPFAEAPRPTYNPNYNPFEDTPKASHSSSSASLKGYAQILPQPEGESRVAGRGSEPQPEGENMANSPLTPLKRGESDTLPLDKTGVDLRAGDGLRPAVLNERYILTPVKSGLMVIDSVRAHRRILYDRYLQSLQSGESVSQPLLFPEEVQLTPEQSLALDTMMEQLTSAGFEINSLKAEGFASGSPEDALSRDGVLETRERSGNAAGIANGSRVVAPSARARNKEPRERSGKVVFTITAVPAIASGADAAALLMQLLNSQAPDSQLHHTLALSLARSNAIRADRRLDEQEVAALIDDLFACHTPSYTPDGKVVITIIPSDEITKRFN